MKKLLLILTLTVSGLALMAQSTLPNGDFEQWIWEDHPTHPDGGYYEPGGGFFKTLNILDTIPTPPGLTCYPTDQAYAGSKAVRLITRKIDLLDILIPGVTGNLTIKWFTMNAALGAPYPWITKPSRFKGYYKAFPLNGDSTGAILLLSKWNSSTKKRDTIAYNKLIFHGIQSDYTSFDVAVDYRDNTTMPDSITVLLLSCGGYNAQNMMGSVGQVGSEAFFDDVTLTDVSGFPYLLMPEVHVILAPNPAQTSLKIKLSEQVKNGTLLILDAAGKHAGSFTLKGMETTLDVSSLSAGHYYYKLTDGKNLLNAGSFIITP